VQHSTNLGVSIVIPTVGREASLERALTAVARAARRLDEPVEAIVVDDGNLTHDRVVAQHRVLDGLPITQVKAREEGVSGPAAARNVGVAAASYDLIAFTDDDACCDEQWLEVSVRRLRGDSRIAGLEGAVRVDLGVPIDPVRARIVMNRAGGAYLTASLFVRRTALETVGGFRTLRADGRGWRIPFREDTDLALRIVRDVGPIPFEPDAFVLHPAEAVDMRRLIRLARYFVVDGAFARLHPEAVPSVRSRPLARLRIRLATAATLLVPGLLHRLSRPPTSFAIVVLGLAVSAQVEVELRSAGVHRGPASVLRDTARRLPRSIVWLLCAGSARLQGEAVVRLGLVRTPGPDDDDPSTVCGRKAPVSSV
jgi:GT2 family glycosyltransferase